MFTRSRILLAVVVFVSFGSLGNAICTNVPAAVVVEPKIIDLGYGYILGEEEVPQATAKSLCDFAGKELVSIETEEEDVLILSLLRTAGFTDFIWTSGSNTGPGNPYAFRWDNGAPMFHTRWWPTHPNVDSTNCVALYEDSYDRLWFTTSCASTRYPLCENKTIY